MKILDIYSWLPAQAISLEKLEEVFIDSKNGLNTAPFAILSEIQEHIPEYMVNAKNGLIQEGKKTAFIAKEKEVIALIGYMD